MSDLIRCPDCEGQGSKTYRSRDGDVEIACLFCGGAGEVGGSNEPAEVNELSDPPVDGHPVWKSPAVEGLPGCHVCFGAGKITHQRA